ncbi:hypothetical protein ACFLZN_02095 [Nanoarchaeota archaeon]
MITTYKTKEGKEIVSESIDERIAIVIQIKSIRATIESSKVNELTDFCVKSLKNSINRLIQEKSIDLVKLFVGEIILWNDLKEEYLSIDKARKRIEKARKNEAIAKRSAELVEDEKLIKRYKEQEEIADLQQISAEEDLEKSLKIIKSKLDLILKAIKKEKELL